MAFGLGLTERHLNLNLPGGGMEASDVLREMLQGSHYGLITALVCFIHTILIAQ
jgi:hypothetical protein